MTNEQVVVETGVTEQAVDSVQEVQAEQVETHEEMVARLDAQLAELQKSIEEKDKTLDALNVAMERTNFTTALAEAELNEFNGLLEITDVNEQVAFIKNAVNQILVKHSYQPSNVAQQEQYTQAINEGNVEKALGFKLANFFKK
ncbi:hypothetical protein MKX47_11815 [Solibacillus sp. FSL R7-0668]|uniref:hypothetical protein n=1 Tax=Solibacillus sp. FSL R7-0668 TaxID=2921688 RepID=UPI0030F6FE45